MHCPHCNHSQTSVLDTSDGVRRRQCAQCYRRFTTHEVLAEDAKAIDKVKRLLNEVSQVLTKEGA
jgi:transcriptional regulator NrdR family protein